ncbi:MAG: YihY family inner membrane protein [Rubrivivax sp.]|nr:YihY family inner membrane protein [Rubrivivax sp.]MDH5338535.1 YihY family inner membrane protein [Rubrivivax sp.]
MSFLSVVPASWSALATELLQVLRDWPWFETLRTLRQRFREDRLGLTAGSLTFTTLIALVPLFTVMLAVFSAFPMFASFQASLEKYFLQSLVPEAIARPLLEALTQFAHNARRIGGLGALWLGVTALATMLTIDRSLNAIWRVRKARPLAQRVLVYWAALTLGPLVIGISMSATSYAVSASRGFVGGLPDWLAALIKVAEFGLVALGMTGLYHYVPNTWVRWRHALAGGLFVAAAFEAAKSGLAWYVTATPSQSALYGTFTTLSILLLWIFLAWVIVLLGAVIAAYAPSLQMRVARRPATPGHGFELAVAVLRELAAAREGAPRGLSAIDVASALRTDPLQVEPALEQLMAMDWVGRLDEDGGARHVLLVDPARTPAAPLIDALLLTPSDKTSAFRRRAGVEDMRLADLLR